MPRFVPNSERIARAAAEAEAKTRAKPPRASARTRAPKPPQRMKIVWAVGRPGVEPNKIFPYIERAAADAKAVSLGNGAMVVARKVPME